MPEQKNTTRRATPAVTVSSAYASGNLIGGKLTFTLVAGKNGCVEVSTATLRDAAKQAPACDLVLFHADPTGTTFTDKAAFDVAAADLDKVAGVIKFATTDWSTFANNSVACRSAVGLSLQLAVGASVYGALVSRGTPTYAAITDVSVLLGAKRDV